MFVYSQLSSPNLVTDTAPKRNRELTTRLRAMESRCVTIYIATRSHSCIYAIILCTYKQNFTTNLVCMPSIQVRAVIVCKNVSITEIELVPLPPIVYASSQVCCLCSCGEMFSPPQSPSSHQKSFEKGNTNGLAPYL